MAHSPFRPTAAHTPGHAWPLWDAATSRHIEAWALSQDHGPSLMERAGLAVARLALAVSPAGSVVWVLTGSGNNGGDGWVAARHLHLAGWPLRVWEVQAAQTPAAQAARKAALDAGVQLAQGSGAPPEQQAWPPNGSHGLLIIDALLGLGARAPLPSALVQAVHWITRCTRADGTTVVLSVDLPSGLQADTGCRLQDAHGQSCAVQAHHTLSLLTLKPGLFTHEGCESSGQVWFDDLGLAAPLLDSPRARLIPASLLSILRKARVQPDGQARRGGHKGLYGDVWLVGGAPGMGGALRLAARAALAAGGGRVHRVDLGSQAGGLDEAAPEVMMKTEPELRAACSSDAVVVAGCGGGSHITPVLTPLLARAHRLVLDADALNAVAADTSLWSRLVARAHRGQATVLTPHPLEAARLLACSTSQVQSDRLAAAQALAHRSGATVVLKGAGSVVASPGATPWVNTSGNARLASGGTGDVLAGWIGGVWASSVDDPSGLHDAVAACVHLHGRAADRVDPSTGRCETAVLPASALIAQMSGELLRAHNGDQG